VIFATVTALAKAEQKHSGINILPTLVSPADIRHLHEICLDFGLKATILPDYSETLDGVSWTEYKQLPDGGTPVDDIRTMGGAASTIEFNRFLEPEMSAAIYLKNTYGVASHRLGTPIGMAVNDELMELLQSNSGRPVPAKYVKERGRLLDAYVDAHKYVFGKKALVYGDADFVVSVGSFLAEIGMTPVLCASGKERNLNVLARPNLQKAPDSLIYEGVDFMDIAQIAEKLEPDLLIGSSKGYLLARQRKIPLVRLGFPVHDRLGAARLRCLGYTGTLELFDRIVNCLLEKQQDGSPIGYAYM
jgi:nitrogenase molybdenum-iron protein NifN